MATAADVARAQAELHEAIAKRLDDAPTGVEPGYDAQAGVTYLPNGRARYRRNGAGAMTPLAFAVASASGSFAAGTSFRPNYDTIGYDPSSTITTSATVWKFTAPKQGWFQFVIHGRFSPNGLVWTQGDRMQLKLHYQFVGGSGSSAAPILQEIGITATSTATNLVWHFTTSSVVHVINGGVCFVTIENLTAVNRDYGFDEIAIFDLNIV